MGATTTQGTGPGEGIGSKGPRNNRNMYVSLFSPHIVSAGTATLTGGGACTVVFPTALPKAPANYVVLATSTGANDVRVTSITGSTTSTGFVLAGTGAQVINYVVIFAGTN